MIFTLFHNNNNNNNNNNNKKNINSRRAFLPVAGRPGAWALRASSYLLIPWQVNTIFDSIIYIIIIFINSIISIIIISIIS